MTQSFSHPAFAGFLGGVSAGSGDAPRYAPMIGPQMRQALAPLGAGLVVSLALTTPPAIAQTRSASPILRTDSISRVARERTPSVVFLHTLTLEAPEEPSSAGPSTPSSQRPRIPGSTLEVIGSGVIIDVSGLILTNAHVIDKAAAIHVLTPDGDDGEAIVVGTDPDTDLALLRIAGLSGLKPAPLGDSDRLNVGDWVVAIGSPFGLHHTVTAGIISAKARGMDDSGLELLQTDAAINPGSSGGALFDLDGALIGITAAILSQAGENIGLNFAIPINVVKQILPQLRTGTVTHGWAGIRTVDLRRTGARALGIDSGLFVVAVARGGPAARAGIRPGDVVLGIAGRAAPVAAQDVQRHVWKASPGATIPLMLWRDGQRLEVLVEVGTRPRQP